MQEPAVKVLADQFGHAFVKVLGFGLLAAVAYLNEEPCVSDKCAEVGLFCAASGCAVRHLCTVYAVLTDGLFP